MTLTRSRHLECGGDAALRRAMERERGKIEALLRKRGARWFS
jgi:hypothetical protein